MKLHLLDRAISEHSSLMVNRNRYPYFLKLWHYHPELELVYICESTGTRFVGDGLERFEKGELVLIGNNLPHMWLNDQIYFDESSNLNAEAIAVHFTKDFLGVGLLEAPEMQSISKLLQLAEQGIRFKDMSDSIKIDLNDLLELKGFERVIKFLELLYFLSKHKEYELLASKGFVSSFNVNDDKKLDKIYAYIFKNFKDPIQSKDVAAVAHMNSSAFSRFFKKVHRKTFTKYLNEIRIGFACKMLLEQKDNVSAVCYESGFNNISNFNRQFKAIVGMSPTEYIRQHSL